MAKVLAFPQVNPMTAEAVVANLLASAPSLEVHRHRLIAELTPFVGLPPLTVSLNIPESLTPQETQALEGDIRRVAQIYAITAIKPMFTALLASLVRELDSSHVR